MTLRITLTLLAVLLVAACDTGRDPQTIVYADLPNDGLTAGGWESSGWMHPWLRYPGRATLEIEHTLMEEPSEVFVYLSFDESGAAAALATGDSARVMAVTSEVVVIRNDTHADFFARVVLR
jgi:hypothetical protein